MSSNVEERVVEMRFDNKQFEKNADQTMKTLDALDKSLDLKGSTEGFKNLEKAAKNLDLSAAVDAVEAINSKFSLLGTIGDQVLRNLTNRAADFAINWAKSMTLDQVSSGWKKYEAKTQAVQVIMHATGQSIDDVNVSLKELTKYTDDTSYRFDQMVDVISGLASAGVADKDLAQIEKVVEGIANAAASAGISASEATGIFFNMRQAFQSHALRGQDWMSLESRGFGTEEFRRTAIETAEAMIANGEATDEMAAAFKKAKPTISNFKDTLHAGWLTDDVLVGVFSQYADRTTEFGHSAYMAAYEAKSFTDAVDAAKEAVASGWANIFEQIFGNYEEAKVFWTEVADALINTFSAPTNALAELLTSWHEQGGYVAFINSIRNAWAAVQGVAEAVKDAFANIFPEVSVEKLVGLTQNFEKMTQRWKQFTSKIDISELEMPADDLMALQEAGEDLTWYWKNIQQAEKHNEQIDKNLQPLTETFQGIFAVLNLVRATGTALFKIVIPFTKLLVPIAKLVGVITSALGRMASTIADSILNSEIFNGLLAMLGKITEVAATYITKFADGVADLIDNFLHIPVVETFVSLIQQVYNTLKKLASPYIEKAAKYIGEFVVEAKKFISEKIETAFKNAGPALEEFGKQAIAAATSFINWLIPALENTWHMAEKVWGWIKTLGGIIKTFWEEQVAPSGVWQYISGKLTELWSKFKEFGTKVVEILKNGGIRAALQWVGDQLRELWWQIRHINIGKAIADAISAATIVKVVSALLSLQKILKFVKGWTSFLNSFPKAIRGFSKGLGIKRIATSLLILASALYVLSLIDDATLWKVAAVLGVLALGVLVFMGALQAMNAILEKNKLSGGAKALGKTLAGILTLAVSLFLIALAFKKIADVKTENIWPAVVALLAVAAILIGGSVALSAGGNGLLAAAAGLLLIAAAVTALIFSYEQIKEKLAELLPNVEEAKETFYTLAIAAAGLLAIALTLGIVLNKATSSLWQVGVLVAAIGVSFLLIALAIAGLSKMGEKDLRKAAEVLFALVVTMGLLVGLAYILPEGSFKKIASLSLMVVAIGASLAVLIIALKTLSGIDDDAFDNGFKKLDLLLGAIAGLMVAAALAKAGGGAMIGLAAVIITVVGVLSWLTKHDISKMVPAAGFLVTVMYLLVAPMVAAAAVAKGSDWKSLLAFAGIVVAVAASLIALVKLGGDSGSLIGAAAAFAIAMLSLSKALNSISEIEEIDGSVVIGIIGILAAIAGALFVLCQIPMSQLIASTLGLSVLLVVLSKCAESIANGFADAELDGAKVAFVTMVSLLATIVAAMWALSQYPIQQLVAVGAALAVLCPIITLCAKAIAGMDKVPSWKDSLQILLLFTTILLPIVVMLALAKEMIKDPAGLISIAAAISMIALAMTGPIAAVMILSHLAGPAAAGNALSGIASIFIIVFGLVLVFAGLGEMVNLIEGKLTESGATVAAIQKAGEVLGAVGYAIGNAVGQLLVGVGDAVLGALPTWGSNISGFFENMAPGLEKFNALTLDSSKGEALKSIAEAIIVLTAAEVLDGIASFITGEAVDFGTFAEGVAAMGPALKTFATETEGIDALSVESAAKAILALSKVGQNLGRTGGLLQDAIGETKSLVNFAFQLRIAAPFLNKFAYEMARKGGFAEHDDKIIAAAKAIDDLVQVANSIHREGGWWGTVAGEVTSMSHFAHDLVGAVPGLLSFAYVAPMIAAQEGNIRLAAGAMQALVDVGNAIMPSDKNIGWGAYKAHAQSLGEFFEAFGDARVSLGHLGSFSIGGTGKKGITSNLVEFAQKFGALTPEDMAGLDQGIVAVQKLVEIASTFQTNQSSLSFLWGLVESENKTLDGLTVLAQALPGVAAGLHEFTLKMSGESLTDLDKLADAMIKLVSAEMYLSTLGENRGNLVDFADTLFYYAEKFANASDALSDLDYESMNAAFQWMRDHYGDLTSEGIEAVRNLYAEMVLEGVKKIPETSDSLIGGLTDYLKSSTYQTKARDAGRFFAQGFAEGITNNIWRAMAAAGNLAESTIQQMRRTLRIESPSRIMRKLGDYTGEGFVLGLEDWVSASATAGDDLAKSVTESAASVLGYIGDLLNGDLVIDMTIRPVLDLTNLQPGMAAIDTMFSQRQAVAAQIDAGSFGHSDEVAELVDVSWKILKEIQNGRDVYLDGRVLATSMNRRLGRMEGV